MRLKLCTSQCYEYLVFFYKLHVILKFQFRVIAVYKKQQHITVLFVKVNIYWIPIFTSTLRIRCKT